MKAAARAALVVLAALAGLGLAPSAAHADDGRVRNYRGDNVKIRTVRPPDQNSAVVYRQLVERAKADRTRDWSTVNSDEHVRSFRSIRDVRCVNWTGPGAPDGLWLLDGNTWVSKPKTASVSVFERSYCEGVTRWIDVYR